MRTTRAQLLSMLWKLGQILGRFQTFTNLRQEHGGECAETRGKLAAVQRSYLVAQGDAISL